MNFSLSANMSGFCSDSHIYISTYCIRFWVWNVNYVVARVPDFEYLIVGLSLFTVCCKAEKQDYRELSVETKFWGL